MVSVREIPSPVPAVSPAVCTPAAALRSVCLYTAACLRAAPGLWLSDGQTHACTAPQRPLSPASEYLPGNSSLYRNHLKQLQSVLWITPAVNHSIPPIRKDTEDTPSYKPANHMLFLDLHFKKEMSVLAINARMKTNHSSQMFSSLIEQFKGPFTPRTITVSFNNHCTSATIVKSTTTITITAFYYPSVWMIL